MHKQSIDSYSLGEFCQVIQGLILDGYRFNFESNEDYPTAFGSFYHAILSKEDTTDTEVKTEEPQEVVVEPVEPTPEEQPKRGRPSKN